MNPKDYFIGDGQSYDLLRRGVDYAILNTPKDWLIMEIGVRLGGATRELFFSMEDHGRDRVMVSIDPYGGIPYSVNDTLKGENGILNDYTDDHYKNALPKFHEWARVKNLNFLFFKLGDDEFFNRFSDGVPIYKDRKKYLANTYALVHFDGPHDTDSVMMETKFFLDGRCGKNSVFVYDDIQGHYEHSRVENLLYENGFSLMEKSQRKASYKKE